jgi:hypothetical protein
MIGGMRRSKAVRPAATYHLPYRVGKKRVGAGSQAAYPRFDNGAADHIGYGECYQKKSDPAKAFLFKIY